VAGQPVVSVDAKKKEKEELGHLPNAGRLWRPKGDPVQVEDHCFFFTGPDVPHAIPFGIYDMTADRGWVNVGSITTPRPSRWPRSGQGFQTEDRYKPAAYIVSACGDPWITLP
jgi:hypothetical protein